jgi:CubicO group peptidase (beta-lactamase class C family)
MERLAGQTLDAIVRERVTGPLGLSHTGYRPVSDACHAERSEASRSPETRSFASLRMTCADEYIAPTELCAWRNRRIVGEVHDENAAGLGGVAGHAGLFSTASDVAAFGQVYLDGGRPLLHADTVAEMTRLQAEDGAVRRGLGFALWSPDPEASGNPFSQRAFGHAGFTGTSLWIDPDRALVVACLTNRVYYGRDTAGILAFRVALHRAIVESVKRET